MKNIFKSKKHIVIGIMIIVFLITSLFVYFNNNEKTVKNVTKANNLVSKNEKKEEIEKKNVEEKKEELKSFYVDIKGQVINPGVYLVNETNIVNDVINFAGGLNENADTKCINLSMKVSEEMVIYIYSKSETWQLQNEVKKNNNLVCNTITNGAYYNTKEKSTTNKSTSTNTTSETDKDDNLVININTATVSELTKLPGIGESKANDIIEYREKNGAFNSIEDIKNISGIGNSTFEKLKSKITV